jgi:GrpB-like predicted nucleotidyltransferase (UPF0157 family)
MALAYHSARCLNHGAPRRRKDGPGAHLRTHPDATGEYGELKRRLAVEYGTDRDGYTNAKSAFIGSIEPNCR